MLNIHRLINSFRYAIRGVALVYREEQNFRIQIWMASIMTLLAFFLHVSLVEGAILVVAICFVLVGELLNSALERFIDMMHPRVSHYVRDLKDILAGIVLVCSFCSTVLGIVIFIPKIIAFLP